MTSHSGEPTTRTTRLVLPVKSFRHGKQRLAAVLSDAQRHSLSLRAAAELLDFNRDLDPLVVTNDDEVAQWANDEGVDIHQPTSPGLNEAVTSARAYLRRQQLAPASFMIAHCDLAFPRSLRFVADLSRDGDIVIVPDRHRDGTNVLCVPLDIDFDFRYGLASFRYHFESAEQSGRRVHIVDDELLGVDLDTPEDLALLESMRANGDADGAVSVEA